MPRPRARPLFALGKYWIAREPGAANLYRFSTDPGSGRTRRASLGTTDIELAKQRLAEIVVRGEPKTGASALSVVLENYFLERTDHLPSKQPARDAGRLVLKHFGPTARISALTESGQRAFCEGLLKRGRALSYVARIMSVVNAAMRYSDLREPRIVYSEAQMRERWGVNAKAPAKRYVPTDDDVARFFAADIPEALRRWAIISCLTGCRPQAAVDLKVNARERAGRLLHLNPEGRAQNKKHRPTVRETRVLGVFLGAWEAAAPGSKDVDRKNGEIPPSSVNGESYRVANPPNSGGAGSGMSTKTSPYSGYATMAGVDSAMKRVRVELGLPRLSPYSFRHKVVTVLRRARVPEDQIAMQLGHKRPDVRTTGGYGEWSPDYLKDVARALDAWAVVVLGKVRAIKDGPIVETEARRAA